MSEDKTKQKTAQQTTQEEDKHLIEMKLYRKENEMILYIKTARSFEDFLKKNKQIEEVNNFCLTDETREIYNGRIDENTPHEHDSATRDLITCDRINRAVLRIKGISNGTEIKVKKLIPLPEFEKMIKNFCLDFKHYYRDYLKDFEINISVTFKNTL